MIYLKIFKSSLTFCVAVAWVLDRFHSLFAWDTTLTHCISRLIELWEGRGRGWVAIRPFLEDSGVGKGWSIFNGRGVCHLCHQSSARLLLLPCSDRCFWPRYTSKDAGGEASVIGVRHLVVDLGPFFLEKGYFEDELLPREAIVRVLLVLGIHKQQSTTLFFQPRCLRQSFFGWRPTSGCGFASVVHVEMVAFQEETHHGRRHMHENRVPVYFNGFLYI